LQAPRGHTARPAGAPSTRLPLPRPLTGRSRGLCVQLPCRGVAPRKARKDTPAQGRVLHHRRRVEKRTLRGAHRVGHAGDVEPTASNALRNRTRSACATNCRIGRTKGIGVGVIRLRQTACGAMTSVVAVGPAPKTDDDTHRQARGRDPHLTDAGRSASSAKGSQCHDEQDKDHASNARAQRCRAQHQQFVPGRGASSRSVHLPLDFAAIASLGSSNILPPSTGAWNSAAENTCARSWRRAPHPES
jgi:hypothetical protein